MKKVYLVGAGPGDAALATVKAVELIASADYIIYDYLLPEELLAGAKAGAKLICVGKRAGQHSAKQDEINTLILKCWREAPARGIVVRLKGGDPFIFGRGGEEAEVLAQEGIPFEVVPGVSSAVAVPAYAGIPLTHRGYSSSVSIFTGHGGRGSHGSHGGHGSHGVHGSHGSQGGSPGSHGLAGEGDFAQISAASASPCDPGYPPCGRSDTLVFLMGMSHLKEICESLLKAGLAADTPAAVIEWGTTPRQQKVLGELSTIALKSAKAGLAAPAVIVVGKVVGLSSKLAWFEKRPLWGKRIVVTRSRKQSSKLSAIFKNLGAEVLEVPVISTTPLALAENREDVFSSPLLFNWLVFMSANGVSEFFRRLEEKGLDTRAIASCKVAAIGSETANSLTQYGIVADFVPSVFVAETFTQEFRALLRAENTVHTPPASRKILIARGQEGRNILQAALASDGYNVQTIALYSTVCSEDDEHLTKLKEDFIGLCNGKQIDCITFTSSSTVNNFFKIISKDYLKNGKTPLFACIGPVTAKTLEENGFFCNIMPEQYTVPELAEAVEKALAKVTG